jgi:hypothetical protein
LAIDHNNVNGRDDHAAKVAAAAAAAAKATINKSAELGARATQAARDSATKSAELHKSSLDTVAEMGNRATEFTRDGINKAVDLNEHAAANTQQFVQNGVEAASYHARQVTDQFTRTLGISGEDSEQLAAQSKRNMEAVTQCGTVLTQFFQDSSRSWFELSQKQWQRNLDGLNQLTRSKSVQEFAAIQSELLRDSLQHVVQDSRILAEKSLHAVDQASKTFTSLPQQNAPQAR